MKELTNPFAALLSKLQARRAMKKKHRALKASANGAAAATDFRIEDLGATDPAAIAELEEALRSQLQAICLAASSTPQPPASSKHPSAPGPNAQYGIPHHPSDDHLAGLSADLHASAARLRALQARHLAAAVPWLPDLPDAALHLVLAQAGPTTRRVCRRFRALHGPPPPALRPCNLDAAAPGAAPADLPVAALPAIRTLDLRQHPCLLDPDAAAAIAHCRALHQLYLPHPLHPQELAALLPHAPTLRDLSPLSLSPGPRYPSADDLHAHLPRFTALRSLHVQEWRSPAPLAALTALTALTKLTFPMLACFSSNENSMAELFAAAAQLPMLRELRVPPYNVAWDLHAAHLLRTLTGLVSLHVGTGQVHPPEEIRAAMLDSIAALTGLTNLVLLEPIRWTTADSLAALAPLPLRALGVGMYCEHGVDTVTNEERGQMVAVLASRSTLTSLYVERAPLDVAAPPACCVHANGIGTLQEAASGGSSRSSSPSSGGNCGSGSPCASGSGSSRSCDTGMLPADGTDAYAGSGFGVPTCINVALGVLHGALRSLDLKHCTVPSNLFVLLVPVRGLRRLQVNYCWWRSTLHPDAQQVPLGYASLGQLTGLTSLTLCSAEAFEAPLQELSSLVGLQELALPQWRQRAAEMWALVPLRELRVLTVCQTFEVGDQEARHDVCAVLQHCVSLQRVAVMGIAESLLQSRCLFRDDILDLAQGVF